MVKVYLFSAIAAFLVSVTVLVSVLWLVENFQPVEAHHDETSIQHTEITLPSDPPFMTARYDCIRVVSRSGRIVEHGDWQCFSR